MTSLSNCGVDALVFERAVVVWQRQAAPSVNAFVFEAVCEIQLNSKKFVARDFDRRHVLDLRNFYDVSDGRRCCGLEPREIVKWLVSESVRV